MTEEIKTYMQQLGQGARDASRIMARAETNAKNRALLAIAETLEDRQDEILEANLKDLEAGREKQLNSALLDRLEISTQRVEGMLNGLRQIAELPDPVGEISSLKYRPSGIQVGQMRVPLGVIGIIYESRPNVTIDAAALCLKSGNAVILRGGSEAINSNLAIAECIREGLRAAGLPGRCVQVVDITDREAVGELIAMSEYVDIIIPRGGRGLIERISRESTIPVIKHLDGICHVYIDDAADLNKATKVAYNAKTRRYGICGAMETLLVDETVAEAVLPGLSRKLLEAGVELRGCERSCALVPEMVAATEEDWTTEYLAPILSVRMVEGVEDAIRHINTYGSHHTDAIVTENLSHAWRFLREVDSSSVMLNASTQFADGYEYGLGAEIGISTDKLHARGPVGLEGLTCQKYVVIGNGHTRA